MERPINFLLEMNRNLTQVQKDLLFVEPQIEGLNQDVIGIFGRKLVANDNEIFRVSWTSNCTEKEVSYRKYIFYNMVYQYLIATR
jgi:hypothetical protein